MYAHILFDLQTNSVTTNYKVNKTVNIAVNIQ